MFDQARQRGKYSSSLSSSRVQPVVGPVPPASFDSGVAVGFCITGVGDGEGLPGAVVGVAAGSRVAAVGDGVAVDVTGVGVAFCAAAVVLGNDSGVSGTVVGVTVGSWEADAAAGDGVDVAGTTIGVAGCSFAANCGAGGLTGLEQARTASPASPINGTRTRRYDKCNPLTNSAGSTHSH